MFTNDYIMRMIEQLVLGIALIMGLKKENRQEEASELLSGTLRKFFGLSDGAVEELPWENLMSVVSLGGAPDMERCGLLGQLIKEKADLARIKGGAGASEELYFKALNMLITAVLADDRLASGANAECIAEILAAADGRALPEDSKPLLFRYYELTGRYGKAEDMLYDMIEFSGRRGEVIKEGEAFYKRLLALDDARLSTGNLPRNEVMEGYCKLTKTSR